MGKKNVEFQGIGTSQGKLVVYFAYSAAGSRRFEEVRIPFNELNHDQVWYELHKAAAEALKRAWEMGGGDEPLDGL